ncbi:hypothetical protein D3C77_535360 [compost metagenome]
MERNNMTHTINSIPWQRLTTAYGRGTELPQLIANKEYHKITDLIEHQGTLWQVTPWVLLVLLQELAEKQIEQVTADEILLYLAVAAVIPLAELDASKTVGMMDNLLDEKYLWSVNEDEDEFEWENHEARGYDSQAFLSYYYYSYELLRGAIPLFKQILAEHDHYATRKDVERLLVLLTP